MKIIISKKFFNIIKINLFYVTINNNKTHVVKRKSNFYIGQINTWKTVKNNCCTNS
jgi:hypothetical protein